MIKSHEQKKIEQEIEIDAEYSGEISTFDGADITLVREKYAHVERKKVDSARAISSHVLVITFCIGFLLIVYQNVSSINISEYVVACATLVYSGMELLKIKRKESENDKFSKDDTS